MAERRAQGWAEVVAMIAVIAVVSYLGFLQARGGGPRAPRGDAPSNRLGGTVADAYTEGARRGEADLRKPPPWSRKFLVRLVLASHEGMGVAPAEADAEAAREAGYDAALHRYATHGLPAEARASWLQDAVNPYPAFHDPHRAVQRVARLAPPQNGLLLDGDGILVFGDHRSQQHFADPRVMRAANHLLLVRDDDLYVVYDETTGEELNRVHADSGE